MKKFFALAVLIFLELTGPDGNPVYVAAANVADVSASGEGYLTARTQIRTVNGLAVSAREPGGSCAEVARCTLISLWVAGVNGPAAAVMR